MSQPTLERLVDDAARRCCVAIESVASAVVSAAGEGKTIEQIRRALIPDTLAEIKTLLEVG